MCTKLTAHCSAFTSCRKPCNAAANIWAGHSRCDALLGLTIPELEQDWVAEETRKFSSVAAHLQLLVSPSAASIRGAALAMKIGSRACTAQPLVVGILPPRAVLAMLAYQQLIFGHGPECSWREPHRIVRERAEVHHDGARRVVAAQDSLARQVLWCLTLLKHAWLSSAVLVTLSPGKGCPL